MNLRARIVTAVCLFSGIAALLSCNYARPPSPTQATQAAAAETLSARLTQASLATPTGTPTSTPVPPTATNSPTPSLQPTATVACDESSKFVSDVTIRDNTVMKPGQKFTKTWRLRNSGNCAWTKSFAAIFVGGSSMGGPATMPLEVEVPPDGTVDISVNLTAPAASGAHRGNYRMRDAANTSFGPVFYVQILVGPTPTPTDTAYRAGKATIDNDGGMDFDSGSSNGDPYRDVWVHYVSDTERYLEPVNGALVSQVSGVPSLDDCEGTSLGGGAVSFSDFGTGSYFCYKTSQGRYGRFQVEKIEADSIGFDFRTWR